MKVCRVGGAKEWRRVVWAELKSEGVPCGRS